MTTDSGKIHITYDDDNSVRVSSFLDNELELTYHVDNTQSIVGNIYVGHIENIVSNLGAAFVRFKKDSADVKENTGYMPLNQVVPAGVINRIIAEPQDIRNGDTVLVQVSKPAVKTKQVALTMKLSISGRFGAVTLGMAGVGCSRKISEEARRNLINRFKHDVPVKMALGDRFGLILRTESSSIIDNPDLITEARAEIEMLTASLDEYVSTASSRTIGSCLYEIGSESELSEKLLHSSLFLEHLYKMRITQADAHDQTTDLYEKIDSIENDSVNTDVNITPEIVTDTPELYTIVTNTQFCKTHSDIHVRNLSESDGSLCALYGLSERLDKARHKRVWLDSGAYLIVESTEAMHVIDVNTGKSIDTKGDLFLKINIEATKESFRQIRLRNLSGMILIDYINMKNRKEYAALKTVIEEYCSLDPVGTRFIDFTGLGIAEIVRNK